MKTYRDFAETLQSFFSTYLVKERGVSSNTIRAYRDTFVHLLNFIQEIKESTLLLLEKVYNESSKDLYIFKYVINFNINSLPI